MLLVWYCETSPCVLTSLRADELMLLSNWSTIWLLVFGM